MIKTVKTELVVERYMVGKWFDSYQVLWKVYTVFGVTVYRKELDREIIPGWATAQVAFLGCTEWKSRLLRRLGE